MRWILLFAVPAAMLCAGCASPATGEDPWPRPRYLGSDLNAFRAPAEPNDDGSAGAAPHEDPNGVVTLRDALALALLQNPEFAASSFAVRAAEARALQSGLLPNPELELEVEEFGGSGERAGFDGAETTLRLSQLLELGGKRDKRERVADLETALEGWGYEAQRLEVLTLTVQAFVDVLAAQERLALAQETAELAERVYAAAGERVRAGKAVPLEETRARVELAAQRIALEKARRDLASARAELAGRWGGAAPAFERAAGEIASAPGVPPLDALLNALALNPDLARWEAEIELRRAAVALEESRSIIDLIVSAGVQRFEETDDSAFVVGLAAPFPLFDRNQGAELAARHNLARAAAERRAAEVRLRAELARAHNALAASYVEVATLRDEILPGAQQAFDAASEGYAQGKLGYLDVLDAQRTLFHVRGQHIDALAAYQKTAAATERLTGRPLESFLAPAAVPDVESQEKTDED